MLVGKDDKKYIKYTILWDRDIKEGSKVKFVGEGWKL